MNHIDGNKLNNHASNLEYVTPLENVRHSVAMGLAAASKRVNHVRSDEELVEHERLLDERVALLFGG